jgi:hypothetical protein
VEELVEGFHLFQLLALSARSVGGFKLSHPTQDVPQLLDLQGAKKW